MRFIAGLVMLVVLSVSGLVQSEPEVMEGAEKIEEPCEKSCHDPKFFCQDRCGRYAWNNAMEIVSCPRGRIEKLKEGRFAPLLGRVPKNYRGELAFDVQKFCEGKNGYYCPPEGTDSLGIWKCPEGIQEPCPWGQVCKEHGPHCMCVDRKPVPVKPCPTSTTSTCTSTSTSTCRPTSTSLPPHCPCPRPTFTPGPKTPRQALRSLIEGNKRYLSGCVEMRDYSPVGEEIANSQAPFASILSCADSRVSPCIVFDVELGNLFQVRLAGNVVDAQALGSLEFSVAVLNAPLIVVMAHTNCGAVKSAIQAYEVNPKSAAVAFPPEEFGAIWRVCQAIYPAVAAVPPQRRTLEAVTRKNVALQVETLLKAKPIIAEAVREGKLMVVGAEYLLSNNQKINGRVVFFHVDGHDEGTYDESEL